MSLKRMINGQVIDIAGSGGGGGVPEGVITSETLTNGKIWTGTLQEYNAILEKDSETLYNITDDSTETLDNVPTSGSSNGVTSGGVYAYVNSKANISELGDTDITTPSANQVLSYNATLHKWVNAAASGGGHDMTPTPAAGLTDAQIVSAINTPQTGADEHVVSAYSVQRWSNGQTKRFIIDGSDVSEPIGTTGVGDWDDTTTEDGWFYIADLYNLDLTDSDEIEVELKFDPSSGEPIVLGGYRIDTDSGKICIKFGNTIATPANARIAVDITYLRNEIN